jgi:hypothetical protein
VSKTLTDYQKEENETARQVSLLHRMPAIGFDNLIADWIYLNFIQYFGDTEARQKTGYSLLPDYLAGVVKRDPHFVEALILIEVGNSLFAGLPQQSVALLEQALEQIQPKFISRLRPYYLWRYKGNNELLFLGDVAQAKKSYQKSIEWAAVYDDQDSRKIQAISQKSLASLNKNSGSKSARIGAWVNILSNTPDPKTVDRVIQEIEQLGGEVTLLAGGRITVKVPDEDR